MFNFYAKSSHVSEAFISDHALNDLRLPQFCFSVRVLWINFYGILELVLVAPDKLIRYWE